MILFKIQFPYKEEILEGSVWESETAPKQWHVTIEDDRGLVGIKVYIFSILMRIKKNINVVGQVLMEIIHL
jgi:hypothetical protein